MTTETTKPTIDIAALLDAEVAVTGNDIPPGSYPGRLIGFTDPRWMKDNFKAGEKLVIDARYVLRVPSGELEEVNELITLPDDGLKTLGANRRSNLYGMLKACKPDFFDGDGKLKASVKLRDFIGGNVILAMTQKTSKKGDGKTWPAVENVLPAMAGLNYPSDEEVKKLSSGDVPF